MGITAVPKETKKQCLWKKGGKKVHCGLCEKCVLDLRPFHHLIEVLGPSFPLKPSATCVTLQSLESILLDVSVNYIIEGWIYDSSILDYQSRLGTHCQSTFERQCIENPGTPVAIHFIVTTLSVLPSTLEPLVTWSVYPLFGSWKLRFVRLPSPPIKPMDHPH